ncbi:MAG: hypothetical protein E6Q75_16595 [Rheinheimera sp.]|nr:MAG: hypothetical protein E6Q75_16595 [Rheinheimera sp.]
MEIIKSFCKMPLVLAVGLHCGQLWAAESSTDLQTNSGIKLQYKTTEQEQKLVTAQNIAAVGDWSFAFSADSLTVIKAVDSVVAQYSASDLAMTSFDYIWTDAARQQIWLKSATAIKVFQIESSGALTFFAGMNLSQDQIFVSEGFAGLLQKTANPNEFELLVLDRTGRSFARQGSFVVPARLSTLLLDIPRGLVLTGHESTANIDDELNVFSLDANNATLTKRGTLTGLSSSWTGSKGSIHQILSKESGGYVVVHSRGLTHVSLASQSLVPSWGVNYLQPFSSDSVSFINGDMVSVVQDQVIQNVTHKLNTGFDFISKYKIDGLLEDSLVAVNQTKLYSVRSGVVTAHDIKDPAQLVNSLIVGKSQLHLPVALDSNSGRNLVLATGELVMLSDNSLSIMHIDTAEKLRQTSHYQHSGNFTQSGLLRLIPAGARSFFVMADKQLFGFELSNDGSVIPTLQREISAVDEGFAVTLVGADAQFMLISAAPGTLRLHRFSVDGPIYLADIKVNVAESLQGLVNAVFTEKYAYFLSKNGYLGRISVEGATVGATTLYPLSVSANSRLELSAGLLVLRDTSTGTSKVARLGAAGEPTWLADQANVWQNQQSAFSFGGRFHLTTPGNQTFKLYETARDDGRLLTPVAGTVNMPEVNSALLYGQYLLLQDQKTLDSVDIYKINRRPALKTAVPAALVNQGVASQVDLRSVVVDEDGDPLLFKASAQTSATVQSNGTVLFPANMPTTNSEVAVLVEDNNGFSLPLSLPYTVNKAPVLSGNASFTVNQSADFTIDLKNLVSDAEGHTVTFASVNKVLNVSSAGVISGKFTDVAARQDQVQLTDQLGAVSTFNVSVLVNAAPTFSGITSYTINEKANFTLDLKTLFRDAENQALVFTTADLPAGLIASSNGVISGQATVAGTFTVQVTATDPAGAAVTQALNFTVNAIPVFTGAASYSMTEKTSFTLDLKTLFRDAEKQTLMFTTTGLPAGLTASSDGMVSGQATATGTFPVQVTAQDPAGASITQVLSFTVNAAPVAVEPPAKSSGGALGIWGLLALIFVARRRS